MICLGQRPTGSGRPLARLTTRSGPHGIAVHPLDLGRRQLAAVTGFVSRSATCCRGRECGVASESTKAPPPAKDKGRLCLITTASTGVDANDFSLPRDTLGRGFLQDSRSQKATVAALREAA